MSGRLAFLRHYLKANLSVGMGLGFILGVVCKIYLQLDYRYVFLVLLIISFAALFVRGWWMNFFLLVCVFCILGIYRVDYTLNKGIENSYESEYRDKFRISDLRRNGSWYDLTVYNRDLGKGQFKIKSNRDIWIGDVFMIDGVILEPEEFDNFSYKKYLRSLGIFYTLDVRDFVFVKSRNSFQDRVVNLRVELENVAIQRFPEPMSWLFNGLVFGSKLHGRFKDQVKQAGVSHIVAVSGFNVSLMVYFFYMFAGIVPRKVIGPFLILFLIFFVLMLGINNYTALRAALMGSVIVLIKEFGRRVRFLNLIVFSFAVLLLIYPFTIESVSVYLSYSALVGIVYASKIIGNILAKFNLNFDILVLSMSAFIFTLPVSLFIFEEVNFLGIIVNLLILPFVPILTILMICYFVLYSFAFFGFILTFLEYIVWFLGSYIVSMVEFMSGNFGWTFTYTKFPLYLLFLTLFLLIVFLFECEYSRAKKLLGSDAVE